jgi:hypothetical protein
MIRGVNTGSGFVPLSRIRIQGFKKSPGSRIRCCHVPPKPESNMCVGQERRVEVANVRRGIHVEYGRGDETRGRRVGIPPACLLA